jgi:hypothetical protein
MATCPHCDAPLPSPAPSLCPACGATLGEPPRKARSNPPVALAPVEETVLFEGSPAAVGSVLELVLAVLTLGLALLWLVPRARATKYKVTSQRVVVETGLLSKVIEQVDLFRAVDFVVELPLGQRLVGCGTLRIEAQDKTAKEVRLDRVRTDVRALYESVRKAAEAERIRRGVRPLDAI